MKKYEEDETVMNQKTQNFLDLYFDAIDENIDEVVEELKSAGNDPAETHNKILFMIKQKKAEFKIEKGKILKARVEELIKSKPETPLSLVKEERYTIAARKLGTLDKEDIESIKKDGELLEDIGTLLNEGKDDAGKAGS
jgi:hypothetical protein